MGNVGWNCKSETVENDPKLGEGDQIQTTACEPMQPLITFKQITAIQAALRMRHAIDRTQAALDNYNYTRGLGRSLTKIVHSPFKSKISPMQVPELTPIVKDKLSTMEKFVYKPLDDGIQVQQLGPVLMENEAVYVGEWSINKEEKHGSGRIVFNDGGILEGHWVWNKVNGKGRLCKATGEIFIGKWKEGLREGQGIYWNTDGTKFEGMFEKDQKHGHGIEKYSNGSLRFDGEFKDNMRNGYGVLKWEDGNSYEGDFVDDHFSGKGTYTWKDGRKFTGNWLNGKMHGEGKFFWPDGQYFEGLYEEDKKHGIGFFKWADGRTYHGNWKNGFMDGEGAYCERGAYVVPRKGCWKKGKLVEWRDK